MADTKEPPKKILIIGGGIAGLTLALSLRRIAAATGINIQPIIYEAATVETYAGGSENGPHWLMWRYAVETLLELGLGKRLSKIAWPILNFKSTDAETKEVLVSWPPEDPAAAAAADPESAAATSDSTLPPMVGLRQIDLLRMLLLAVAGVRDDLIESFDFAATGANNSDLSSDAIKGLEGDLARGDGWFEREGYAELIGNDVLRLGYELESYLISATSGGITARFTNGHVETCFMLIGADGLKSTVRDLLGSGRYPPQFASSVIAHGITRTHVNPEDVPTELEDHRPIPNYSVQDLYAFCPDGNALSVVGRGLAFGCTNIGNGMLGWNLIAAQNEPFAHVNSFTMQRRRNTISQAIAARPRQSIIVGANTNSLSEIQTDATSAEDKWATPGQPVVAEPATVVAEPEEIQTDKKGADGVDPLTAALAESNITGTNTTANPSPSPTSPTIGRNGRPESPFARQLRESREEILASRASQTLGRQSTLSWMPGPSPAKPLPSVLDPIETLHGSDARTLALRLAQNLPLPNEAYAVIARTDPAMTVVEDVMDNGHQALDTYTSPNFHPGRVMLIGDAAHPITPQAHGCIGGGLAITDAALLAKLIGKHLGPSMRAVNDESALENMSREFDRERGTMGMNACYEARAEGSWSRTESGWLRSVWKMSFKATPVTWSKATYDNMLTRGKVKEGYVSLKPF
ncbi:hypothetical protein HDV00_005934 [Rhizophlyctis rosea]|nr:hypothetical protein HDV00_005934 [Rhizophlyctis rosea]